MFFLSLAEFSCYFPLKHSVDYLQNIEVDYFQSSISYDKNCSRIFVFNRLITMSLTDSFIASLILIQRNIYRYSGPILMVLGSVSCTINLLVFTKNQRRKNPFSIYFVAYNISNFLFIFTSVLLSTLAEGYDMDPSSYNLSFCRFQFYMVLLLDVLCPSYLILASVDRVLITSRNALTRQRSTTRLAYASVSIITLFWVLLHIHALILTNITEVTPNFRLCYFQQGLHATMVNFYGIIVKGIVIPLLMMVLGLWAVRNVRSTVRVIPAVNVPTSTTAIIRNTHGGHWKDRQLLRILLVDISVYIIFNLMLVIVLIYQQFHQPEFEDPARRPVSKVSCHCRYFQQLHSIVHWMLHQLLRIKNIPT